MSYKDGIARITGRIGEAEVDQLFKHNGLYFFRPPGLDIGIDRVVSLNEKSTIQAKIQIKGRRQISYPRWFQLNVTPDQISKSVKEKTDLNNLWLKKIDMVDFWILVSIPKNEIWVFPSQVIHEIASINSTKYKTRNDNDYSRFHYTKHGKIAKKQKELNLDIKDNCGIVLTERFSIFRNNINPLIDFLRE